MQPQHNILMDHYDAAHGLCMFAEDARELFESIPSTFFYVAKIGVKCIIMSHNLLLLHYDSVYDSVTIFHLFF